MPLPQISTPTYELTIPSSKKKIKYRPFLVREEKILILALESENEKQIADAIKTTLKGVIFNETLSSKVPSFRITNRYLFFNLLKKRYFILSVINFCKYHKNILIFAV